MKTEKEYQSEIQQLVDAIDSLEDEKLEITNQFKKALADYQNLEKNNEKFIKLRSLQMKKHLVEEILPVMDALTIALNSSKDFKLDDKSKAWADGISASIENLEKALVKLGLTKFEPKKGEKFDSEIQEAVATIKEGKTGHVFDTLQPGYRLDEILIRPARVVVSN